MISVTIFVTPCAYESTIGPLYQQLPCAARFQFFSNGVQEKNPKHGIMKLKTVTRTIENQTIAVYSFENFKASKYVQMDHLSTAIPKRFMFCARYTYKLYVNMSSGFLIEGSFIWRPCAAAVVVKRSDIDTTLNNWFLVSHAGNILPSRILTPASINR